jgi:hypothetical protein
MKPSLVVLLLFVACLFAACNQPSQVPKPLTEETPLLTDADLDKAHLRLSNDVKELVGFEENKAAKGKDLPALANLQPGLSTQAVLPDASGYVFYAQLNQSPVIGAIPYSLYRHYQGFDDRALIYSGFRQIQSVAGSLDGLSVVVSMRETTDASSDFEIFLITFSEFGEAFTFQLTSDDVDNINVSVTADVSRIVYEETISGGATVILRTRQAFAIYDKTILVNASPQRHPSISSDGQYIVLVRDPLSGSDSVEKYTVASNSYLTVAGNLPLAETLEFPSISADGQQVLWLQTSTLQPQDIKLVNLSAATLQTVASGSSLRHPFLTANGRFITYQEGRNIVTKDLATAQVQALTTSLSSLISFYSPMWQLFYQPPVQTGQLRVTISGLPSTQKRVRVTGPNSFNSGLFSTSQTFTNLTPGVYTVSAQGFLIGRPGKPSCRIYWATPATQTVNVVALQTVTATVTYESEPCD